MTELQKHILLLCSFPIYALIIPLEVLVSHVRGWKIYSWRETLINIYLTLTNAGLDLLLRGVAFGVLIYFFQFRIASPDLGFIYWLLLFLAEDLLFYVEHYVDHHVRIFWAVHVTHHSSDEYNLSTGFRSSVLMPFYRYLYFIPLALLGFRPFDIFFMYALTQTYGILVHTQSIHSLPKWVEYVFVTPSHHRVHHASNIPYLDKNMGMVLIIWDRIFGTFAPEFPDEPPKFGLNKPVAKPHHPVSVIFHEWAAIARDMNRKLPLVTKLKYLTKPPGWSHDGSSKTSQEISREWYEGRSLSSPQKLANPDESSRIPSQRVTQ